MARAIAAGQVAALCAALCNDFESLVEAWHPVVKEIKLALRAFGAAGALMSGSGPTVFGLFESLDVLREAKRAISRHYPSFLVCTA
jgi:4-diphosphocytidyl-2-C-methyl-D-erythritol kinase